MATHRRSQAVIAEQQAKKTASTSAKGAITSLDAYALLKNPNSKQVEEAINLLAAAVSNSLKAG